MSRDKEAIVICLDVGKNSSAVSDNKNQKTFFERSIECARKIIVRKIFAKPNDEIGIILFGSDTTANQLNNEGFPYKNIKELGGLEKSSWRMVEELSKIKQENLAEINWSDALIVALNYVKIETEAKKFSHLRIILFTNFLTSTNDSEVNTIIFNLAEYDIELIGVSDSVCQENSTADSNTWQFSQNPQKKDKQLESERIFEKMINNFDTANLCHIDYVESELVLFQKKTSRGNPWNVTLKIGGELAINVSVYVYIQTAATTSFKTECIEQNTVTRMVTEYTKNNEVNQRPNEEDTIKAYMYGSKIIPCDDSSILYDSGDKCLSCLAMCKKKKCSSHLFMSKGCHVVVPQKDCPKSAVLFGSLVQNMFKKDYFMLARKVYRRASRVVLVALFPQITEDGCSFVMVEMPFGENIQRCRYEKFRMKESTKPSDEQMDAMQNLVESMDLTDAIDDDSGITEAFTMETSPNPFHQYICRTVSHRALNPAEPLPTFHDELRKMIDVPEKIKIKSADVIEEIEKLFPLEIIQHKEKKVFGQKSVETDVGLEDDEMSEISALVDANEKQVVSVGTITPAEDFLYLVQKKAERFDTICQQIQSVVYELIFKSTIEHGDVIKEAILAFRDTAKIHSPFNYNTWINELKKMVIRQNKIDEWNQYIVKEGFGLITINESPISTITTEESLEFYEIASNTTSFTSMDDELENLI